MSASSASQEQLARSIELHRSEVHGYLSQQVGCMDTAADIFQSIVESLLHREPNPPIQNVRAYLYRAAKNASINHRRSEAVRAQYAENVQHAVESADTLSPDRVVEGQEALVKLTAALAELPALTREIFVLYRIKGMKQTEIAQRFDLHVSTVEKRLRTAVLHCQARLRD